VLAVLTTALHGLRLHRATGRSSRPAPADLIRRYRTYFLAGVLSFRGLSGVPPMVNLIAIYELRPILPLFVGWVAALVLNFAFVPAVLRRWERSNSDVLPWLALDGALAIGLNVWGAAQVPGPVNEPYHDLFFFWCMGTAILWAAWFGTRAGMLISLVSLPLQVVMTAVSGWVPLSESVPVIVARTAWLVVGTSSGWLILWIMRIAAEGVRAEGVRVGEKTARIRALRQLHDTALQTLEAIRLNAENERLDPQRRLEAIRDAARWQAADIRDALAVSDEEPEVDAVEPLSGVVRKVSGALGAVGTTVTLNDRTDGAARLPLPRSEALCDAVREALNNVRKHAGAKAVVVEASVRPGRLAVTVRDDGRGFDAANVWGFGIRHSLVERLAEVDGGADIRSEPGRGTEVGLWVPR
jgi:signal transduction histidine kinase